MLQIVTRLIKQDMTQASAQNHTQHAVEQCIIQHFPGKHAIGLLPDAITPQQNEQ